MDALDSLATLDLRSKDRIWNQAVSAARNSRSMFSFDESQAKNALNQLYRSKVEWHKKLALPVTIIIFFLIGAPLGAIVRRGGLGMPIVISVIFFVIYYIISSSGEKMAKEGYVGGILRHVALGLRTGARRHLPHIQGHERLGAARRGLVHRKIQESQGENLPGILAFRT